LKSIRQAQDALLAGNINSLTLVEQCLAAINADGGQGSSVFTKVHKDKALAQAELIDIARSKGLDLAPYTGIPVSVKDLFDIAGDVTTAGSRVLMEAAPAKKDAVVVERLKQAGFIIIGRTNMTEFAYSGLGINPHNGTPLNPYDRATGRIPGGSSSGAAVAQTDNMALAGIGTDTGGSCRIPAALCGIVGLKSTANRIPSEGTLPLSGSLDSIGPLTNTVECCAIIDAVLAGEPEAEISPLPLQGIRLAIPQSIVLDDMDTDVAKAFEEAIQSLSNQGAVIIDEPLTQLLELPVVNAKGGFAAAEAYTWHHKLMEQHGDLYDPRVISRILKGRDQSARDYIELLQARERIISSVKECTLRYDALIYPSVPTIAPRLDDFSDDEFYQRYNLLMLRNPAIVNFLDRCAISIPIHKQGEAPVGLSLVGQHGEDRNILSLALAAEGILSPQTNQ
jgi:aspartyl-tRNA(Asn)/glutamyl-tRNA(Gln) amidotransferase subunit A